MKLSHILTTLGTDADVQKALQRGIESPLIAKESRDAE
jgi:hypothetical protein